MSTTPIGASVTPGSFPMGPLVMERYAPRGGVVMQGTSAELIAEKWDISREDMDAYAVESHKRAATATAETASVAFSPASTSVSLVSTLPLAAGVPASATLPPF